MATTSQSFPRLPADVNRGASVDVHERVVPIDEIVPVGRANGVLDLVGNTPLLEVTRLTAGLIPAGVRIYAKLEGNEDSRYRPLHAFIVEKTTPGLSVSKPMDKMGMLR